MEGKIDSSPSLSLFFRESFPSWRTRGYKHNVDLYERYLGQKKHKNFNLLEIGKATRYIDYCVWQDYFSNAKVFCALCDGSESYAGQTRDLDQSRTNYFELGHIEEWIANKTFEVVIDSSGQDFAEVHQRFEKIFSRVNTGGLYFIERVSPSEIMRYSFEMGRKAIDAQDFTKMTDESRSFLPDDYGVVVFEKKNSIEQALENVLGK